MRGKLEVNDESETEEEAEAGEAGADGGEASAQSQQQGGKRKREQGEQQQRDTERGASEVGPLVMAARSSGGREKGASQEVSALAFGRPCSAREAVSRSCEGARQHECLIGCHGEGGSGSRGSIGGSLLGGTLASVTAPGVLHHWQPRSARASVHPCGSVRVLSGEVSSVSARNSIHSTTGEHLCCAGWLTGACVHAGLCA